MAIINFTVNYDVLASATDSSDVGVDADIVPLIGSVLFEPVTTDDRAVLAPSYTPRPAGLKLRSFTGFIDVDGRLKSSRSGAVGVRLWANDPVLQLARLTYKVTFSLTTPMGEAVRVDGGYFEAPSTDQAINLANVLQSVGSPSVGITKGEKGDRGYSFVGLVPAGDGTSVVGLIETAQGVVPAGDPIPISLAYNSTVTHATVASTPRPPVSVAVIWIGSAQPSNAIDGDVWLDTSGTAPTITTTTINGLNIGATFNQILVASGTTPLVWSVSAGSLPTGLTLSTAGSLYGSPTASGSYNFTVQALNPLGTDTQQFTGTIGTAIAPTINTTELGALVAGNAVSLTLSVSGSVPVTFAVQSGSLPTGLSLNTSSGEISGSPSTVGSYSFTVRATNSAGFDDQAFSGSVTGVAPTITTTSLSPIYRAFAVSQTLAVTGTQPATFALQSGSLPAGLSLNTSTGVISGTPTTVASYSFTIRATNSYGTDDQAFTGSVLQSTPAIVQTVLNAMSPGTSFSQTLTLTTGGPTITWSIQSGALPTGLSLNTSTGTITGTPATEGSYTVTIRASNGSEYDDQVFTGSVSRPPITVNTTAKYSGTGPYTVNFTTTKTTTVIAYPVFVFGAYTPNGVAASAQIGSTNMTAHVATPLTESINMFAVMSHQAFVLSNVAAGSHTVTYTPPGGSSSAIVAFTLLLVAYENVGTVGTAQTKSITTKTTNPTHTISSSSGKTIVHSFAAARDSSAGTTSSAYNQTELIANQITCANIGQAAGAASVTFSLTTNGPAVYSGIGIELTPA